MAKRGRPPKNGASVETKRRPEIPDKEHLLQYLAANPETEYPFVESVWEQAVERANINKDKQQAYAETTYVDEDGNEVKERKKMGVLVTDPVKYYFKLMGLKQNRNKAISIQNQKYEDDENKQSIMEAKFDTSGYDNMEKNMYVDEIGSWIDLFNGDEKQYLKRRYVNYYDTYEINEGADKLSLKRLLSIEIELYRIDKRRASGKPVNLVEEEKLTKQLNMILESLKWTKKQRSKIDDMAQNKFTIYMDSLMKEGKFKPKQKTYDKDEVDFLLDTYVKAIRDMLS